MVVLHNQKVAEQDSKSGLSGSRTCILSTPPCPERRTKVPAKLVSFPSYGCRLSEALPSLTQHHWWAPFPRSGPLRDPQICPFFLCCRKARVSPQIPFCVCVCVLLHPFAVHLTSQKVSPQSRKLQFVTFLKVASTPPCLSLWSASTFSLRTTCPAPSIAEPPRPPHHSASGRSTVCLATACCWQLGHAQQ